MLHFSIIQTWYVVTHLSEYLEEENKKENFAFLENLTFFKCEEEEGESMLKLN